MKKKIIICICGGLGNQFFQYAVAYTVAKKNNYSLLIDTSAYNGYIWNEICGYQLNSVIPNLQETKSPFYCKLLGMSKPIRWPAILIKRAHYKIRKKYTEKTEFIYDKDINLIQPNTYIYGYFQSYKYFANYSNEIINMFSKLKLSINGKMLATKIQQQDIPSIAIHFRDYTDIRAGNKQVAQHIGMLDISYYKLAISIIKHKYQDAIFYVFSNNIENANKALTSISNLEFIDYNYDNTWEDMKLMSLCDHNIIANSSYSWWAAYLNTNKNKTVIAPKSWGNILKGRENSNDLFPNDWIQI